MTRVLLLCAVGMLGCGDEPDELDRAWTSSHFVYRSRSDDTSVCEGVMETLEAHRRLIRSYLGLGSSSTAPPIEYRKYRDGSDLVDHGPCDNPCVTGTTAWAHRRFCEHELIHAYLFEVGNPHQLLSEGAAASLSCNPRGPPPVELTLADLLTWNRTDWRELELQQGATMLVGHLLRTHGPAPFVAWYEAVSRAAAPDEIRREYTNAYGGILEDAWSAATATRDRRVGCLPVWPRSRPRVTGGEWSLARACDGSDKYRVFEIPDNDVLRWAVDRPFGLVLRRAEIEGRGGPRVGGNISGVPFMGLAGLEAGTYFFSTAIPDQTDHVSFNPAFPNGLAVDCGALPALSVEKGAEVRAQVPADGLTWYLRFVFPEPAKVILVVPEGSEEVSTCTGCGPSECELVTETPTSSLSSRSELLLRVEPPTALLGYLELRVWNLSDPVSP